MADSRSFVAAVSIGTEAVGDGEDGVFVVASRDEREHWLNTVNRVYFPTVYFGDNI